MSILEEIKAAVIDGRPKRVTEYTEQAVAEGVEANDIINDGLIAGMSVVGTLFKRDEIYVPEVLIAAQAMHAGMGVIRPLLTNSGMAEKGTVVIGTVKGDMHDIGKNLVSMMLECSGYRIIDLGVNVQPERFIQAVAEHKPQIVGLSALLTTTLPAMKTVLAQLQPYRPGVKIIVGGAPVTQKFADEIGADGYAANAGNAAEKVEMLLGS